MMLNLCLETFCNRCYIKLFILLLCVNIRISGSILNHKEANAQIAKVQDTQCTD